MSAHRPVSSSSCLPVTSLDPWQIVCVTGQLSDALENAHAAPQPVAFTALLALQVALFKYIVNVEGNCAALRLKHLLAGPSAVFFVQSDEIEWFYPLLKPYVHYIPVSFSWPGETHHSINALLCKCNVILDAFGVGLQRGCSC